MLYYQERQPVTLPGLWLSTKLLCRPSLSSRGFPVMSLKVFPPSDLPLRVIQQLRGPNFTQFWPPTNCRHTKVGWLLADSWQNSTPPIHHIFIQFFCTFWKEKRKKYGYSHLSNKRGAHALYLFWKIPPSAKQKSTLHVYWFLRFFHPPLLVY